MRYRDIIERDNSSKTTTSVENPRGIYPEKIDAAALKGLDPKEMKQRESKRKRDNMDEDERDKVRLARMPVVELTKRRS